MSSIQWGCQLEPLIAGQAVTVGSKLRLHCSGPEAPVEKNWVIEFDQLEQAYTLVVLQTEEITPTSVTLLVTGYKPGSYTGEGAYLSDGVIRVSLEKTAWTVESVITSEAPQPYPPYGPWALGWPAWLLWAGVLVLSLLLVAGLLGYRAYRRKRRLQREIEKLLTHRSAYWEFFREFRILKGKIARLERSDGVQVLHDLERLVREYLVRRFRIPAHRDSLEKSLQYVLIQGGILQQRTHELEPLRERWVKWQREIQKTGHSYPFSHDDYEQMARWTKQIVESIESLHKGRDSGV